MKTPQQIRDRIQLLEELLPTIERTSKDGGKLLKTSLTELKWVMGDPDLVEKPKKKAVKKPTAAKAPKKKSGMDKFISSLED